MTNHQAETTYALLWSSTQHAFHVEPLSTTLKKARQVFLRGHGTDYSPLFIGTDNQCRQARRVLCEYRERLREQLDPAPVDVSEAKAVGDLCDEFMADLLKRMARHQQHDTHPQ